MTVFAICEVGFRLTGGRKSPASEADDGRFENTNAKQTMLAVHIKNMI
jgi:hypothetical protein